MFISHIYNRQNLTPKIPSIQLKCTDYMEYPHDIDGKRSAPASPTHTGGSAARKPQPPPPSTTTSPSLAATGGNCREARAAP